MLGYIIDWMEDHPYLFLVPPILVFLTVDYLAGVNMKYLFVFTLLSFIIAHFTLVGAKYYFKREREGRNKVGIHRYSFPSYHTGIATVFCLVQSIVLPLTAPLMLIFIFLTAYGRVRLDLHDRLEVMAGVFISVPVVMISFMFVEALV